MNYLKNAARLAWIVPVLTGCQKEPSIEEVTAARFTQFASKLTHALREEAESRCDYENGMMLGFDAQFTVQPIHSTDAELLFALVIDRYYESGHHEGKGRTKQTEWTKYRGVQTIAFAPQDGPPGWTLIESRFDGQLEHKPLSTYTDFASRTVTPVNDLPDQNAVIEAALRRLAQEQPTS